MMSDMSGKVGIDENKIQSKLSEMRSLLICTSMKLVLSILTM